MNQPNGLVRRLTLQFAKEGRKKTTDEIINVGLEHNFDVINNITEESLETIIARNSIPTSQPVLKTLSLFFTDQDNPNSLFFGQDQDCMNYINNIAWNIDAALIFQENNDAVYRLLMKKYYANKNLTLKQLKTLAVLSASHQPSKHVQKQSAKNYFNLLETVGLTSLDRFLNLSSGFYKTKQMLMNSSLSSRDHANINIICLEFIVGILQGFNSMYK